MFEDSTFESTGRIHTRSRRWMIAVFFFNTSILLALILIPLLCPQALPRPISNILVVAPAPQPQPRPNVQTAPHVTEMPGGQIFAPPRIPTGITILAAPEQAFVSNIEGMGPAADTSNLFHGPSGPRVVHPDVRSTIRVPSTIEEGLLIRKTMPVYPPIALAARIEGTVRLAATISRTGSIENLRVASGPAMLHQAALNAVQSWRYRPYILDGQPVEVETTVDVIFTLSR